jgi:hypothetical protein
LPQNRGFAELLNGEKGKSTRNSPRVTVVVYFLQPDMRTPLSSLPTNVQVKILAGRDVIMVPLAAEPDANDAVGKARFESKPGAYRISERAGDLIATIDGQSVSIPFRGPR